ncbi:MAG TPA: HAMP domain-containing sensor histidine kinase [Chloroflexota bacterium]|nr:HAMP domain-containing sensor histidine kinase [Chloroflexota bacterium]
MSLRLRLGLLYGGLTGVVVLVIAAVTLYTHAAGHSEQTVHVLAAASAGGVVLALALGWLMAGEALRPVSTLTEAAAEIARSRGFDRRVPPTPDRGELGQLTATFNAMLASLERAYEAEKRFVSDASHELRAPLTAIQANLDLLERRPDVDAAEREEAVREAAREARRLGQLVSELLALARADAGVPLRTEQVELDRVVLETVAAARHLTNGHELRVERIEPAVVDGDPARLKQLLLILLDNAAKYTPGSGRVSVAMDRRDGQVCVTVRDTGPGIPADELPRVFERFYRVDAARTRDPGGTGLGLPIARWIAEQHGGAVALESVVGEGTTAVVRLPLIAAG